jgi:predicted RNA-binding protein associated with RNAse of E/G family
MSALMRFTKWGGKLHWHYRLEPIGSDEHGRWFGARSGTIMRRGYEEPVLQPHDFVTLVPYEGDWIANFNPFSTEHEVAVYIDVTTRPSYENGVISAVDLDLDVIRLFDGSVRVLDEDEFAEHQVRYGYPPSVITRARATTDELVGRMTAGIDPFETAAAARLAAYLSNSADPR